jgi:CBS domain-containing protein
MERTMKARAIMTPEPRVVTIEDTVSAAAQVMKRLDVGMLPVVEDLTSRRLKGVITDRDITIRHVAPAHNRDCTVESHMSAGPVVVAHLEEDVHQVLSRMEYYQVRRVPVVNDYGAVVGLISSADVALRMGPSEPLEVERLFEAVSRPEVVSTV